MVDKKLDLLEEPEDKRVHLPEETEEKSQQAIVGARLIQSAQEAGNLKTWEESIFYNKNTTREDRYSLLFVKFIWCLI